MITKMPLLLPRSCYPAILPCENLQFSYGIASLKLPWRHHPPAPVRAAAILAGGQPAPLAVAQSRDAGQLQRYYPQVATLAGRISGPASAREVLRSHFVRSP